MLIANIQIYDSENYEKLWYVRKMEVEKALAKAINYVNKKDSYNGSAIKRLAKFLHEDFKALGEALGDDFGIYENDRK